VEDGWIGSTSPPWTRLSTTAWAERGTYEATLWRSDRWASPGEAGLVPWGLSSTNGHCRGVCAAVGEPDIRA
jgi:hypothetical protein